MDSLNNLEKFVLGIDNGLTSTKVALFRLNGEEIYSSSAFMDLMIEGDIVEKDAEILWETTARLIKEVVLKSKIDSKLIISVAISSHGNGVYFKLKNKLRNAIMPMDKRAENIVSEWMCNGTSEKAFNLTLQSCWAGQAAPILRWLKTNERSTYEDIESIMLCKDYIKYKLTGSISTDFSDVSAWGIFDNSKKTYNEKLFEMYDIEEIGKKLPAVQKS